MVEEAEALFTKTFGGKHEVMGKAPGRINLLGEHTDYQLGFCLPIAIPLYTYCCIRKKPSGDDINEIVSTSEEDIASFNISENAKQGWAKHIAAIAAEYKVDFAFQASFSTEIPLGAGLSSSAAFEVSFAIALEQLIDHRSKGWDARSRALLCVQACNGAFVGIPCGILDQFSSSCCEQDHLLFLDCLKKEGTSVRWPDETECVFLITNTMVKHSHATGEYSTRVHECQQAAKELGVSSLRMASIGSDDINLITRELTARARHVIGENARCLLAKQCIATRSDWNEFGRLMNQSHASLRDDFKVSCPELDFLVQLAQQQQGVLGSRMTGGGFGGCLITLCVNAAAATALANTLEQAYWNEFHIKCTNFQFARPAQGATVV